MKNATKKNKFFAVTAGDAVIDKISYVETYPQRGTKINVIDQMLDIGGTAASAASTLSNLGINTSFIGSWGNDVYGNIIDMFFEFKKISVRKNIVPETPINNVYIDLQYKSRTIYKTKKQKIVYPDSYLINIFKADIILLDREDSNLLSLILANKKRTTKIIIDTSTYVTPETIKLFINADYSVVPFEFVVNWDLNESFAQNLQKLNEMKDEFWVTAGDKGCMKICRGKVYYYPTLQTKVIDTLGAGDVFRAGFIYAALNNFNDKEIGMFANSTALVQCLSRGNCLASPSLHEVMKVYKKMTKIQEQIFSLKDVINISQFNFI